MTCSVEGCAKSSLKRGFCNKHYLRWWKYGDPVAGSTEWGAAARFFNDVVLAYEGDECLIWPFAGVGGYGQIRIAGKLHLVTRLACEAALGAPPTPKHEAAHACGNGHLGCATKKHLRWATRQENRDDMVTHGRSNKGKAVRGNRLSRDQRDLVVGLVGKIPDAALARQVGVTPSAIRHYKTEAV